MSDITRPRAELRRIAVEHLIETARQWATHPNSGSDLVAAVELLEKVEKL